ncbi:ATP-binding protein [Streptomyces roseirectus]|uniref:ATP-binding protein n=1 Tax=Streptomyces roseirectus TaxID=2768066 RepID=A0A7H0IJZ3_9ACTN|nr:ATP-binding protein [Streptomyces roseirectus]QNP73109.1 ATP-binding protein [Streptomyces roseirectus]
MPANAVSQSAAHQYPRTRRSVGRARDDLRRQLTRWRAGGELVDDAELLLSELVTNAVKAKARPDKEVRVEVTLTETELRLEVADACEELPVVRHAGEWDEDGRGLILVEALASEWGVGPREGVGKVVWAVLKLTGCSTNSTATDAG